MYEHFYALREKPFALTPDPAYLYLAKRHRYALTMLDYAISQASGFALITGEVGCGKTTVVRHLLARAGSGLNVAFITNAHPGFGHLLPWLMEALGLEVGEAKPNEQYRNFVAHVKREYTAGRRTVLVIDEAQNLGIGGLEELRVLSNINVGKELLVQTIVIGQPELRAMLKLQALRQFAQRIAVEYHLEALQADETAAYILHRLHVAGGSSDLFAPETFELIHRCTRGIPRLINIVCDTALVYGFADEAQCIDAQLIRHVVEDRGGILPLTPLTSSVAPALVEQVV
jgi:general secretion pathway protein A